MGVALLLRKLNAFLKRYAAQLTPFLQKIFSLLETAVLPDDWLCAKVIPIHISGNKQLKYIQANITDNYILQANGAYSKQSTYELYRGK